MAVYRDYVLVVDQKAIHIFSMMGVWLTKFEAFFPEEPLSMAVMFPYVYISSTHEILTFKMQIL